MDPLKPTRVRLFKKHIKRVLEACKKHYGPSKYQTNYPSLVFNTNEEDIMGGYYDYDDNEITINYQGFDDSDACFEYYTNLVNHEYIHFMQYGPWYKRYAKTHDYLTNPYEIEAYSRENEILKILAR